MATYHVILFDENFKITVQKNFECDDRIKFHTSYAKKLACDTRWKGTHFCDCSMQVIFYGDCPYLPISEEEAPYFLFTLCASRLGLTRAQTEVFYRVMQEEYAMEGAGNCDVEPPTFTTHVRDVISKLRMDNRDAVINKMNCRYILNRFNGVLSAAKRQLSKTG